MAENTKNLGLVKPSKEDFYNIEDFNLNFQRIDDFLSGRGYYIGNVDELKTPGTYVVTTFSEGMSGVYPLPAGWWYTVIVSLGGTGSIIQDWILATEPNVPMRRFTRHFDGNYWCGYFESVNAQNFPIPGKILAENIYNITSDASYTVNDLSKYNMIQISLRMDVADGELDNRDLSLYCTDNILFTKYKGLSTDTHHTWKASLMGRLMIAGNYTNYYFAYGDIYFRQNEGSNDIYNIAANLKYNEDFDITVTSISIRKIIGLC